MSSTINTITVEGESSITVTTVGTQGVAGPNTVLGRSVADSTASTAGSLLVYDHANTVWVDSQSTAAQSLNAKLFNLGFTTGGATVTQILDEDNLGSNSNTALATQQSIKAYVDAELTSQDLDIQGDSGGALSIDLDSETLTIAGGTGVASVGSGNTVTISIDSTVATLTGTQTLTNKTLTSPDINGGDISSTATINKSPVITLAGDLSGSATLTQLGNATLTATIVANSVALGTDTTGNYVATIAAGEGIDVSGSGSETAAVTISAEDATASNKGVASFDSTDFTVSSGAVTLNAERVQDIVGAMVSSNTESGIAVSYEDSDGTLDFNVADPVITLSGDVAGSATMTNLGDVTITTTVQANSVALGTDTTGNYVATIAQANTGIDVSNSGSETAAVTLGLNTEHVQDLVGAMFSSNTETGITATYQDSDGTIDLVIGAGDITNAMLAGSIANAKLANSTLTVTDGSNSTALALGGTLTFTAGSGIDITESSGTVTVAAEDATDSNKGVASFDSTDFTVTSGAVTVNAERVQDIVGAMVSSNSESGIGVTYQDSDGTLDFNVDDFTITLAGDLGGSVTITDLASATLTATVQANSVALGTDTTGNYVATIADAGNSRITVANSGSETAAVTLDIANDAIGANQIADNSIALGTKTTGNYVATIADAGNSRITVANSGSETAAVTLDIANDAIGNAQIANNAVTLGTQTTGNYVATIAGTSNEIVVTGSGSETAAVTIGLPSDVTIGNNLTVTGNLTVNGTTTTVNTANLDIEDATLRFAKNATTLSATNGAGLEFGGSTSKPTILWDNSNSFLTTNKTWNVGGTTGTSISAGQISLKNTGTRSRVDFYCESSNAHYARVQAPAHSAFSGNVTLTLPVTTSNLVGDSATQTLTNKTINASNNTLSNIANSSLTNSSITVSDGSNTSAIALGGTLTFSGTSNEVEVAESSGTVTVGLPAAAQITTSLGVGGGSTNGIQMSQGAIAIKNGGTQSRIDFYCESSNAHYARLQAPAHSAFSGNVTLTLPAATGTLIGTGDSGTVTNGMLAGSIANSKLANSTVSFGGISLALGASDATPAFDLSDATNYPTSSLSGTITNAQLAGSIAASKLAGGIGNSLLSNSSITVTDGSNSTATALGGTITFSAGEGIDVTESSGTITIAAEDATASNKGVASFDSTDFSVSSGAVTLQAERIQDIVGSMVSSNSESGISVTYQDSDGTLDFDVADPVITIDGDVDGSATMTNLGNTTITVALDNSGVTAASYGSATAIPVITVDAKGRITAASTAAISTSFTLSDGSNTQTISGGDTLTVAGTSNEVDVAVSATDTLTIGLPNDVTISNNLVVSGNLSVTGTTTQTGSVVTDNNFTGLTNANTGNSTDFGFYGKYVESSTTKYAGLFYDASTNNTFRLFCDTQTVPSTTVNTGATGYAAADLVIAGLTTTGITLGGAAITSTAAEINILDGVTSTTAELNVLDGVTATTAELNVMDGDTSATSTTLADADRVVVNDAGTMKQVALTDFETYFESALDTLSNVTTVGTLGSLAVTGDLTVNTNVLKVDTSNNRVGIKDATPAVTLDIGTATDAIHVPTGTTAQRPGSPSAGMFRFNTTLGRFEGHDGSDFSEIGGGGGSNTFTVNTYTSSGSAAFTLSQAPDSEDNLLVFVEGVFMNQNDYTLNGTTLTLDEAPPSGRKIVVYSVRAAVSGSNLNHDQFTCNGNSSGNLGTEFTLSIAPVSENNTQVFLDGVYQQKTDYSVSGTTLTMDTAPSAGAILEVMTFTQTSINVPVNDTVDTVHLKTDAVTTAKITDANVTRAKIAADAIDATKLADGAVSEEHLDPTIISGLTAATPVSGDSIMFLDATDSALKKADVNEIMATAVSITSAADAVAMSFDVNENATFTGTVTATGTSVFANLDISGDVDIDGTTNLDVVDIDGAVDMASTLTVGGATRINADFSVSAASGEDRFAILPQSAGNGSILMSGNAGLTGYEPLTVDFESLALRTSGVERVAVLTS
ncbi:MAG: hypothetical protein CMF11_02345, partial [Idiomarina sp.]|nr:hypothetical protein [Idiomarina sp.]